MGNKMKGIFKGFKFISNIFAGKERELEIGCPTDVKHVAHIGWDGPSGNAPSWMNQFMKGPDFAAASIGNSGSTLSPWATSQGGHGFKPWKQPLVEMQALVEMQGKIAYNRRPCGRRLRIAGGESNRGQSAPEMYKDSSSPNKEVHTKKHKRRKPKATTNCSPNSTSSSSSKSSSRTVKTKAKFVEDTVKPASIEVAS